MYKEKIINLATGEIVWRDYTEEEIAIAKQEEKLAEEKTKQAIRAENNRKSAITKLAALGLTEDEIAAL